VAEHARASGVVLAIEALHPMYAPDWCLVSTLSDANDWSERLGAGTGVAVDAYHTWWDPNLEAEIKRAGKAGRLAAFHISDWLVPTTDLLLDRGLPGDGVIDLKAIAGWMKAAGYDGWVEVEIFSNRLWEKDQAWLTGEILARCRTAL
jgi:sugar phosphate isomerase/epimerase